MNISSKKGFTLIELLVVIAIIAILAAILFPVFSKAREKARQATCLNNQKQLGLGLMMYVQDYSETYPVLDEDIFPSDMKYGIWYLVAPYTKSYGVIRCPSTRQGYWFNSKWYDASWRWGLMGVHRGSIGYVDAASSADIYAPSNVIAVMEVGAGFETASAAPGSMWMWVSYAFYDASVWTWMTNAAPPHNNGAVFTFADGHAKWLNVMDLKGQGTDGHWVTNWTSKKVSMDVAYKP